MYQFDMESQDFTRIPNKPASDDEPPSGNHGVKVKTWLDPGTTLALLPCYQVPPANNQSGKKQFGESTQTQPSLVFQIIKMAVFPIIGYDHPEDSAPIVI